MQNVIAFLKKEPVLTASFLAAVLSCLFVHPDAAYLSYLDLRTLALLYCLMVVVAGLNKAGVFWTLAYSIGGRVHHLRLLVICLTMLTFVSSMLITNDVALITFVPFSIMVLTMAGAKDSLIWVIIVQTIAANMGSMLTPVGNPQNLYLFSFYNLGFGEFFAMTLPVWLLSLAVSVALCFRVKDRPLDFSLEAPLPLHRKPALFYLALFALCLLVVFRLVSWYIMLVVLLAAVAVQDRKLLLSGDFILLATFVCFFVFSGNLARMEPVRQLIGSAMKGRELVTAALASQCISNVPAALLLSSFTDNARGLVLGADIGGLGTPIASMASLISYKLYCAAENAQPRSYMKRFLVLNFLLLALFLLVFSLI